MTEQTADEVDVERARDRLAEEEGIDRRPRARGGGQRLRGEMVPRRVRDHVRRDGVALEHVPAGIRTPEREVQEEGAVHPPGERIGQHAEGIARAHEDLLEVGVDRDVAERSLVLDGELGDGPFHEGWRGGGHRSAGT